MNGLHNNIFQMKMLWNCSSYYCCSIVARISGLPNHCKDRFHLLWGATDMYKAPQKIQICTKLLSWFVWWAYIRCAWKQSYELQILVTCSWFFQVTSYGEYIRSDLKCLKPFVKTPHVLHYFARLGVLHQQMLNTLLGYNHYLWQQPMLNTYFQNLIIACLELPL